MRIKHVAKVCKRLESILFFCVGQPGYKENIFWPTIQCDRCEILNCTPLLSSSINRHTSTGSGFSHRRARDGGSGGHCDDAMAQSDTTQMRIVANPPLISANGIQSEYELLGTGTYLMPTGDAVEGALVYDRRSVQGDVLRGDAIPEMVYPPAGAYRSRYTKVTSSGLVLSVDILNCSLMRFVITDSEIPACITGFEVQGTINSADDILLSDTHIVYVNKCHSSRFSGVYVVTFDYKDIAKQHPSKSLRHFQISASARLSWADKAHTLAMIFVTGSSCVVCIKLGMGKTTKTIYPKILFPDTTEDAPGFVPMVGELKLLYFGAEIMGTVEDFPSAEFCHTVTDEVYESTVATLKYAREATTSDCIFAADGGFLYSFKQNQSCILIKGAPITNDSLDTIGFALSPLCTIDFSNRGSVFWRLNEVKVLHLGGDGPAALFVLDGRVNGRDYLCYVWMSDTGVAKIEEYSGDMANTTMFPRKLYLGFADNQRSVVMTDKKTYYVKR